MSKVTGGANLAGRVALVTGAGNGLGREVALALCADGAELVLCGRDPEALHETAQLAASRSGATPLVVVADVSAQQNVEMLYEHVRERFGSIAILVNAAGVFGPIAPLVDAKPDEWIQTLLTNAVGPYLTCRYFAPSMVEDRWGRIVNVSSAAAFFAPGPLNSAYATSKVALNQLTRHLAAELEGTGVTANVLHPGSLKTVMSADIRARARDAGPAAETLREWADLVEETGGDSMERAVELVLRLASPANTTSGAFCWPEGMTVSQPLPTW